VTHAASMIAAVAISIVTLAEARFGHELARWGQRRRRNAELWLGQFTRIPVDEGVAEAWVRLKASARRNGLAFGTNDLWIAATALFRCVPIITCDRDFLPMRDLGVEVIYLPRRPVVS
jgi:predicted nucleic acid-binding protein